MNIIFDSVYFGFVLSIASYQIGRIVNKKLNMPYTNPLLIGGLLSIAVVLLFKIPVESYLKGGGLLEMLHKEGSVIRTDYFDEYIEVEVILQPDTYGKVRDYIIE